MTNSVIPCPNCGVSTVQYKKVGTRYICSTCQGWTVNLGKKIIDLEKAYGEEYFKGLNPSQNSDYVDYDLAKVSRLKNHRKKFKRLQPLIDKLNPKVLELGSATGDYLKILQDHGIESMGIEISEHARKCAAEQGVQSFSPEGIESGFQPNILIAWDVWEHLENPADYFEQLLLRYKDIATIALTTVDAGSIVAKLRQENWRQFHPPTHINYPTQKSFDIWAKSMNFQIVAYEYIGYSRPLFEYLKVFGIKTRFGKDLNLTVDVLDIPLVIMKRTT